MDIALSTDDRDLHFVNGDLYFLEGVDAVRQHLQIRLQFFLGEWFLDEREGIPYFQTILGKVQNIEVVNNIFRDAILGTPGVESISRYEADYDGTVRKLSISFTALTDTAEVLDFSEEFIVA